MSDVAVISNATPVAPVQNNLVAYSSIRGTDDEAKMRVLEAISDAEPMQEKLGQVLAIVDLIILNTTVTDRNTGEIAEVQRTVIIQEDGTAVAAMSGGIIRSLNNLLAVYGEPHTWNGPKYGTVVEAGPKGRQYYTIKWGKALPKKG